MSSYIPKFKREIECLLECDDEEVDDGYVKNLFEDLAANLDLGCKSYSISDCRDTLNKKLQEAGMGMFIIHFLHIICLSRYWKKLCVCVCELHV